MPDFVQTPLLVEMAIEPWSKADQEKLAIALAQLSAEDQSFRISDDRESGQIILNGTSESHLENKLGLLRHNGIAFNVGAPQVAFRERPTSRAEVEFTHKKIRDASGEFASVKLVVDPNAPGEGYQFEAKTGKDALPERYMVGIKNGIEATLACGVVAGFPVIDVRVELADAKYHDVDSTQLTFEIAARAAFREALLKAKSQLLEPIMKVDVETPREHARAVIDDLILRRGVIERKEFHDGPAAIEAMVPLITMFGYDRALRFKTDGRATFTMRFAHYSPAPLPEGNPPFRPAIGMRA